MEKAFYSVRVCNNPNCELHTDEYAIHCDDTRGTFQDNLPVQKYMESVGEIRPRAIYGTPLFNCVECGCYTEEVKVQDAEPKDLEYWEAKANDKGSASLKGFDKLGRS